MVAIKFYEDDKDIPFKYAVIVARANHQWVFCKHKQRTTYEIPGGHREPNEDILATAKRELFEETGATDYTIKPISAYSVTETDSEKGIQPETFGMLFYAEITAFGELPNFEMEKVMLFDELPSEWAYPLIQPQLIEKACAVMGAE